MGERETATELDWLSAAKRAGLARWFTGGKRMAALVETRVYRDVHAERQRAHAKHGANGNSREDASWINPEWLPVLMEELGEVAHELTYDVQSQGKMDRLRAELVQVAAMACAWIDAIDDGDTRV